MFHPHRQVFFVVLVVVPRCVVVVVIVGPSMRRGEKTFSLLRFVRIGCQWPQLA